MPARILFASLVALSVTAAAATLRVAVPAIPPSQGVPFTSVGQPSSLTWSALFDGLTHFDPDGTLQPALALSWTPLTPLLWRFALRPNVRFHDGTPVTAEKVAASLALLRTAAARKFYVAPELENVVAITAIGPLTLEIATRAPDAILPRRMSILAVVEPETWAAKGEAGFAKEPVGTGPYKLVDWGNGSGIAHLAAADSWRRPRTFDRLELVPLENPVSRMQALLSDRVDVAARINGEDIAAIKAAGYAVASLAAPQVMSLAFRVVGNPRSPIADVRVRRALGLAVDRNAMAAQLLQGLVAPAGQPATPETAGHDPALPAPVYDPERARALLREAGYPNGFRLTAEVMVGVAPADEEVYQQAAQDLSRIGVTLTLRAIPYATWLRKYSSGDWTGVDAFALTWDSAAYYDVSRVIANASCRKPAAFFCDPSVMPLLDAVDAEMDEAKRRDALRRLEARTVELAPALWLVSATQHYGLSPRLAGVALRNSGVIYEDATLRP